MGDMTYTAQSARAQILTEVAAGADELWSALAALSEAYEQLDDSSADLMEEQLFRPLQAAYGQLARTHAEFAARYGLPGRELPAVSPMLPATARVTVERAAEAVQVADATLSELQDSMLPVEVGDRELREGLERTRTLIAPFKNRCVELIRTLGR
jgi:hypothetical protein